METNNLEEQMQSIGHDEKLEKESARVKTLRRIAFEHKSEFIKEDKTSTILSVVIALVLIPALIVGFIWLRSHPIGASNWLDSIAMSKFLTKKASLFYAIIVLMGVSALTNLFFTLVIHNKLNLWKILDEDVSIAVHRIRNFNQGHMILSVVLEVFRFLILIVFCVLFYEYIHFIPFLVSRSEAAEAVTIAVAITTIIALLDALATYFGIRSFSSHCEDLIKVLEE